MQNNEIEAVTPFIKEICNEWNKEKRADTLVLIGKNQGTWTAIASDLDGRLIQMARGYNKNLNELDHCYIVDTITKKTIKFDHSYEVGNEN